MRLRHALGAALACIGAAATAADLVMPSCVPGSPPLRLPDSAERLQLDAADRRRLHEAAQARYPLYQQGGMVPAQAWLMRRGGHWEYATLWQAGSGLCLSAVFSADRFDFTPGWLARYKPRAGEALD